VTTDLGPMVQAIADVLVDHAIGSDDRATWLAPTLEPAAGAYHVVERSGDPTLYDGSAGIALVCSAVGRVLGRDDLTQLAVRAARHALDSAPRVPGHGLYDGTAGIALAALVVGHRAGVDDLADAGLRMLGSLVACDVRALDLISGLAGIALAFARAAEVTGDVRWVDAANRTAVRLIERADRRTWGWAWPNGDGEPALCGLAHGGAGVAFALAEVGRCADIPSIGRAIGETRRFERSWFDPRTNTWPDLRRDGRRPEQPPPRPALWCHGAVGIGVSRLAIDAWRSDPAHQAEVAAALRSSCAAASDQLESGDPGSGLTLCHGLGGTVDLLVDAHLHLGGEVHLTTARWIVDRFVAIAGEDVESWPGGVQRRAGPGAMTGLAGVLAILARLQSPTALPALSRLVVAS
jgi:lantibiotic biosynthesis protein